MKRIFLAIIVLLLSITTKSFASSQLDEISAALQNKQTPDIRTKLAPFIRANKDASQKDAKLMKVLDRAQLIVIQYLSKKYDAKPENYEQKIGPKEDRELYKIVLDLGKKRAYRGFYICKGNLNDAIKSQIKSSELMRKADELEPTSDKFIAICEQILGECFYNERTMWPLIAAYRYNSKRNDYREKYTKIWLRIIQEDQVVYNYSDPVLGDDTSFPVEFRDFLNNNNLHKKLILTKEQVQYLAEATVSKYPRIFDRALNGVVIVDEAYYTVQQMVVLPYWLNYYKLYALRAKFIDTFFTSTLVKATVEAYARNYNKNSTDFQDFKEIWDYLNQRKEN